MAKAFYTQDETKAALNVDDDGLKDLASEGRLTEYRDGQRLMYKGTQVEALAGEMGRGDAVDLSDTGGTIGLADSSGGPGGSGSAIGLAGNQRSGSGPGISADDTAGGFSLSDSDAGVDPVMGSDAGASGITIFGPDDSGVADPAAQTNLGDSSGEQVNLEGIGSGSGLLDLTQEPDDTSFGAETFDEIMPGESGMGTAVGYEADTGIDTGAAPAGTRPVGMVYEPPDASAPIFGGLAGGTAAVVLIGLLAVAAAALGADEGALSMLYSDGEVNGPVALGLFLGLPIIGLIIGLIGGKMANS